jgi:hypothetical protein
MDTFLVFCYLFLMILGIPFQILGFLAGFVWVSLFCGYKRFTDGITTAHRLWHT